MATYVGGSLSLQMSFSRLHTGAMDGYGFRIHFTLASSRLGLDETAWAAAPGVRLSSTKPGEAIREAGDLVLRGEFFQTAEEAEAEGGRWLDQLRATLARLGVGADFGDQGGPSSRFSRAGLEMLGARVDGPVLNDVQGLSVYPVVDPPAQFIRAQVTGRMTTPDAMTRAVLSSARASNLELTPTERTALTLYETAFFQSALEAKLVLWVSAIETLLVRQSRAPAALEHVRKLIELTQEADPPDAQALLTGLGDLRTESIGAAGRRHVGAALGGQTYMDQTPEQFFKTCYNLRSRVVHKSNPRPDPEELRSVVPQLGRFVGHLLCGDLLADVPDPQPPGQPADE